MSDRVAGDPGARRVHNCLPALAVNDEALTAPDYTSSALASTDDPCAESGYDERCRDPRGQACPFHERYCHAPDYRCVDLLRHQRAVAFLEAVASEARGRVRG